MSFGLLKRRNNDIPGDGGEVVKKLLQRMAAFDVIDERLHGHACADKHRGSAQNVGIRVNDGWSFHGTVPLSD